MRNKLPYTTLFPENWRDIGSGGCVPYIDIISGRVSSSSNEIMLKVENESTPLNSDVMPYIILHGLKFRLGLVT
jgi:hypothetical protein